MKDIARACAGSLLALSMGCATGQPCRSAVGGERLEIRATAVRIEPAGASIAGAAVSPEGTIFLLDNTDWRVRAYGPEGQLLFELDAPSPQCLISGGPAQGFCLADDLNRRMLGYDQRGKQLWAVQYDQHSASSFVTAPSGEFYILDGLSGSVAVRSQAFSLVRKWNLPQSGQRPRAEAIAVDQMAGLVVVADPWAGRLATYSLLGAELGETAVRAIRGPQSIAFDQQGCLWVGTDDGTVRAMRYAGRRWQEAGSVALGHLRGVVPGNGGGMMAYSDTTVVLLSI